MNKSAEGKLGETLAVDFLSKKGYRILERNFRYGRCEIDIIAGKGPMLVFVEVKARRSTAYGEPVEAVTPVKCRRLRRAAGGYLALRSIDDRPCRFDIVAIRYAGGVPTVEHYEDAF